MINPSSVKLPLIRNRVHPVPKKGNLSLNEKLKIQIFGTFQPQNCFNAFYFFALLTIRIMIKSMNFCFIKKPGISCSCRLRPQPVRRYRVFLIT